MVSDTSGSPILVASDPRGGLAEIQRLGLTWSLCLSRTEVGLEKPAFPTGSQGCCCGQVVLSTPLRSPQEGVGPVPQHRHSPHWSGALHSLGLKDKIFT